MQCTLGPALFECYEIARENRNTASDILLRSSARRYAVQDAPFQDLMLIAKQKYSDALVAWVSHRAFCTECHGVYGGDDVAQFASV